MSIKCAKLSPAFQPLTTLVWPASSSRVIQATLAVTPNFGEFIAHPSQ